MPIKKRGYFFTLDAVLGLSVLVIGVFIVTSYYVNAPQPAQVSFLAGDMLDLLSDTRIKDLNNPYAGIGGELWNQGEITTSENSLLQQIGEFYATGRLGIAEKFIQNVSKELIPYQFRYEVWVNSEILYPLLPSPEHISSKESTALLLTSKKLTFGILNKTTTSIWGPYKAEVFVWEK